MWVVLTLMPTWSNACQVCSPISFVARRDAIPPPGLCFTTMKSLIEKKPTMIAGILVAHRMVDRHYRRSQEERTTSEEKSNDDEEKQDEKSKEKPLSSAMIVSIGFYKRFISPLLPPACRFLPTCSQYGVQAISEFGPSKGAILIAWRLLRCSPIGGRGYDPPKWPPVEFSYSSY